MASSLSRQHFTAIANVLFTYLNPKAGSFGAESGDERRLLVCIALDLSEELARFNPRFKRSRFLAACGVTSEDLA